jgi:Zn-dependent metalloprotease
MKKIILTCLALSVQTISVFASGGDFAQASSPYEIRYIKNNKSFVDPAYQESINKGEAWQKLSSKLGAWQVIFNETTGKPHKAWGNAIAVAGGTPESMGKQFINDFLKDFNIPMQDLVLQSTPLSKRFQYVHFYQNFHGRRILNSHLILKFTLNNEIVQFGCDVFSDININPQPSISLALAENAAKAGIAENISSIESNINDIFVLPIPNGHKNNYHLVYQITVNTDKGANGIPGKWECLVDAHNGTLLSRTNKVVHVEAPDVTVSGNVYPTHLYNPAQNLPLMNLKITEGGNTYYTDANGLLPLNNSTPVNVDISLEGKWSKVITNGATPSFSATANPGTNTLTFDNDASIQERCGYYHVNLIHDYMRSFFTTWDDTQSPTLDNALPTNIDLTTGNCNAFYNGTSINFYALANGCNNLAQAADVVYHEYGHGISDKFYDWQGSSFINGAMGEGYSDVWGCSLTQSPLLGVGFSTTDQDPIRRYDINPKVYPQDIQGQVHADGEIIAGAWWDISVALGIPFMMDLFTETHWELITGPDGTEGQVYYDILIAALQADDVTANGGDNNYCNGTPNGSVIAQAFANHGITLVAATNLAHQPLSATAPNSPITISTTVTNIPGACGFSSAFVKYRTDDVSPWQLIPLTTTNTLIYDGVIPAQPAGTIVRYFVGLLDNNTIEANIKPSGANLSTDVNIPYYILVGYDLKDFDDLDNNAFNGNWTSGAAGDDAVTGIWDYSGFILPSFIDAANPASMVQPGTQHTPGGTFCAFTGNAGTAQDPPGTADVDDGKTTLISPPFDATNIIDPAFTYYRWYSNDQGATPKTDYWQTFISGDGVTWVPIENTLAADHSWRMYAFKIADYTVPTANMRMKFIAEDANAGSLIEAAIDDLTLWGVDPTAIQENGKSLGMVIAPNPAKDMVFVGFDAEANQIYTIEIRNSIGQLVYANEEKNLSGGHQKLIIPTSNLEAGMYFINLKSGTKNNVAKLSIAK